ncbi:ribosome biogenesis GTP-binding protein YihA/YsxC [Camelliibacillus cellulosilyticus]|uniref:Probable GTP-binding protein EngB n=1 Tax=Camelliibacillus cellulosilyticus TaxID=2174486 RepID=A0ABV9GLX2_9BACL
MIVRESRFVTSAVNKSGWPDERLPEIALAGRSNVGKSSLINTILGRKNLARTSQKPGKTQTLNYFIINDAFYLVDVPGYGYAKVSKSEQQAWAKMLEGYFSENKQLRAVVQLVDFRHPPSALDVQMYDFLKFYDLPVIIAATKCDKIAKGKYQRHRKIIKDTLHMNAADPLVTFSSFTGVGKDELWDEIEKRLG